MYVITSESGLYRDAAGERPLARLIGPFATKEDAQSWLDGMQPLWGDYSIVALAFPGARYFPDPERA